MKKSAMLKRAKKHLWDGREESMGTGVTVHVCLAIGEAQESYANVAKAEQIDDEYTA